MHSPQQKSGARIGPRFGSILSRALRQGALDEFASTLASDIKGQGVLIGVLEQGDLVCRAAEGTGKDFADLIQSPTGAFRRCVEDGEPITEPIPAPVATSVSVVPIKTATSVIGVVGAFYSGENEPGKTDLEKLSKMAELIANLDSSPTTSDELDGPLHKPSDHDSDSTEDASANEPESELSQWLASLEPLIDAQDGSGPVVLEDTGDGFPKPVLKDLTANKKELSASVAEDANPNQASEQPISIHQERGSQPKRGRNPLEDDEDFTLPALWIGADVNVDNLDEADYLDRLSHDAIIQILGVDAGPRSPENRAQIPPVNTTPQAPVSAPASISQAEGTRIDIPLPTLSTVYKDSGNGRRVGAIAAVVLLLASITLLGWWLGRNSGTGVLSVNKRPQPQAAAPRATEPLSKPSNEPSQVLLDSASSAVSSVPVEVREPDSSVKESPRSEAPKPSRAIAQPAESPLRKALVFGGNLPRRVTIDPDPEPARVFSNASGIPAPLLSGKPVLPTLARASMQASSSKPPRLIKGGSVIYPQLARSRDAGGTVQLELTVDETGKVKDARALSGPSILTQAALAAVKSWVYEPAQLDGKNVETKVRLNVQFTDK